MGSSSSSNAWPRSLLEDKDFGYCNLKPELGKKSWQTEPQDVRKWVRTKNVSTNVEENSRPEGAGEKLTVNFMTMTWSSQGWEGQLFHAPSIR
jgi:hypothetical protein